MGLHPRDRHHPRGFRAVRLMQHRRRARAIRCRTTYLARILRLTLLAPEIVEGVLDGQHKTELLKAAVQADFPSEWEAQRALSLTCDSAS